MAIERKEFPDPAAEVFIIPDEFYSQFPEAVTLPEITNSILKKIDSQSNSQAEKFSQIEFKTEHQQFEVCGTLINNAWLPIKTPTAALLIHLSVPHKEINLLEEERKSPISPEEIITVIGTTVNTLALLTVSNNKIHIHQAKLTIDARGAINSIFDKESLLVCEGVYVSHQVTPDKKKIMIHATVDESTDKLLLVNLIDLIVSENYPLFTFETYKKILLVSSHQLAVVDPWCVNINYIENFFNNNPNIKNEETYDIYHSEISDTNPEVGKYIGFSQSSKWFFTTQKISNEFHKQSIIIHSFVRNVAISRKVDAPLGDRFRPSHIIVAHNSPKLAPVWLANNTLLYVSPSGKLSQFDPENNHLALVFNEAISSFSVHNETHLFVQFSSGKFGHLKIHLKQQLLIGIQQALPDLPTEIHKIIFNYVNTSNLSENILKHLLLCDNPKFEVFIKSSEILRELSITILTGLGRRLPFVNRFFSAPTKIEQKNTNLIILLTVIQVFLAGIPFEGSYSEMVDNIVKRLNMEIRDFPGLAEYIKQVKMLDSISEFDLTKNSLSTKII